MALTYQGPFILQWAGEASQMVCAQAQYSGVDASITIQPIDLSAGTPLQLWLYGSDQRLYLYAEGKAPQYCVDFANPATNSTPLLLNNVISSDQTQQWGWSGQPNGSTFLNVGAGGYCIDNRGGGVSDPGNVIQLYQTLGNANQDWAMVLIPALAPQ